MLSGKGALVWKIRDWAGGDPDVQVQHALALGLDWVSLKLVDAIYLGWEDGLASQNKDLAPVLIPKLRAANIVVSGWGYTYGLQRFAPYGPNGANEGKAAQAVCRKYGIRDWLIDAESEYERSGTSGQAGPYCDALLGGAPDIDPYLCAFRFPIYHTTFPFSTFLAHCKGHAPQLYFEQVVAVTAAVNQLSSSIQELQAIRTLPYIPILPGYEGHYPDKTPWRASPAQLTAVMQKAKDLKLAGVGLYALDEATPEQLVALGAFQWHDAPPPPAVSLEEWAKGIDTWSRKATPPYTGPTVP